MTEQELKYPIGKAEKKDFSEPLKNKLLQELIAVPPLLELAIQNLDEYQLHTPYREGGWSPHQIIHHLADASLNYYLRCKFALTETNPAIMPFEQDDWLKLGDTKKVPVNVAITLLFALHEKWLKLLEDISSDDWQRTLYHPLQDANVTLWDMFVIKIWHFKHHTQQIVSFRERMNW